MLEVFGPSTFKFLCIRSSLRRDISVETTIPGNIYQNCVFHFWTKINQIIILLV